MKIKRVEIIWNNRYLNSVGVRLIVDEYARFNYVYNKKVIGNHTYYFSDPIDGFVNFAAHDPEREYGSCGRTFNFLLKDGTVDTRKGVWSSRSGLMVKLGFKGTTPIGAIKEGSYAGVAYDILSTRLAELLDEFSPEVVYQFDPSGSIHIPRDQPANDGSLD